MVRDIEVQDRWEQLEALVKDKLNHPRLWQVLEKATPLCLDDDYLVLGFGTSDSEVKAYASSHQASFELAPFIKQVFGEPLKLLVFENTSLDTYIEYAARRAGSLQEVQAQHERREQDRQARLTWDETWLGLRSRYQALPDHSFNQIVGRFLMEVVPPALLAMEQSEKASGTDADTISRNLNRITERIGSMVGCTGLIVALEYLRFKDRQQGG